MYPKLTNFQQRKQEPSLKKGKFLQYMLMGKVDTSRQKKETRSYPKEIRNHDVNEPSTLVCLLLLYYYYGSNFRRRKYVFLVLQMLPTGYLEIAGNYSAQTLLLILRYTVQPDSTTNSNYGLHTVAFGLSLVSTMFQLIIII